MERAIPITTLFLNVSGVLSLNDEVNYVERCGLGSRIDACRRPDRRLLSNAERAYSGQRRCKTRSAGNLDRPYFPYETGVICGAILFIKPATHSRITLWPLKR